MQENMTALKYTTVVPKAVKEHMRRNGSKIQNTPVMLQLGRTVKGTRYSTDLALVPRGHLILELAKESLLVVLL